MRRNSAERLCAESAPVFAALGDATRLRVVARLGQEGPLSTTQLTAGATVSRQAMSKHLRVLASADLVKVVRAGRETIWELRPQRLVETSRWLDVISSEWDGALARLAAHLEAQGD
ncbi:MAG TPA: metalloregulator ArsR/SmtB family transcription factor [Polyangiaceae bacterium]